MSQAFVQPMNPLQIVSFLVFCFNGDNKMGRFEQIAKQVSQLPMDKQDVIAGLTEHALNENAIPWSVLTDEQAEIVRKRMEKPFGSDVATKEEVAALFASKHG